MDRVCSANSQSFRFGLQDLDLNASSRPAVITVPPKRRTLSRLHSTETIPVLPRAGFFSLPFELRWQVYEILVPLSTDVYSCNDPSRSRSFVRDDDDGPQKLGKASLTQLQSLLLVCRRMYYDEPIKEIFYRYHTFLVDGFTPIPRPLVLRQSGLQTLTPMINSDKNQYFLERYSWNNTMPLMRKMVLRLAPPGGIMGDQQVIRTNPNSRQAANPMVDFEHHAGWKQTLGNLSVLGLHILNSDEGEKHGFAEWLFQTLWSLVGALPVAKSYASSPFINRAAVTSATLPAGPMIVVYIEGDTGYGGEGRAQEAKDIVESIIPKNRFRYVSLANAMETPFLDRKRIESAWGSGESQDLDAGVVKEALEDYLEERKQSAWEREMRAEGIPA